MKRLAGDSRQIPSILNCYNGFRLAAKRSLSVYLILIIGISTQAQCLLPSAIADTMFPVTNRYNTIHSLFPPIAYNTGANIFNIVSDKGRYYVMGDFANLTRNQGPALVIDSGTTNVHTPLKWKINGNVFTAIPDGQGGYFIGGDFTKIGDSIRTYIARIDANGKPTAWNAKADNIVRLIQNRNDTLFIAGDFTTFLSKPRQALAIYSLTGDSLVNSRLGGNLSINSFLLYKDTLIFSGLGVRPIRKYNIKDSIGIFDFDLRYEEYGPANHLTFNEDSTGIAYVSEYNGETIKAFNTITGTFRYAISVSMNLAWGSASGTVFEMKSIGSKVYVVGYFEQIEKQGFFNRKGFFTFDGTTGQIGSEDLQADGYPTFMNIHNGKLYLSGNFNWVNSVQRLNFAVVDTGTLAVGSWQINPSDEMTAMAFNNGTAFIAGHFNGINAIIRNGFAAIDSATGAILPWNPVNSIFTEGKRMVVRGDTLFVLGITSRPNSCMVNDFNTAFRLYRLSDGQELPVPDMQISRMYDFIFDGNYMYASVDNQLRRFNASTLTKDLSWGNTFFDGQTPIQLMLYGDKILSVGDNRFVDVCTTHPARKGWVVKYNKSTGVAESFYSYQGENPIYDQTTFDHAVIANDKLYVQGFFNVLNGKARRNFACIDLTTGALTDWATSFYQSVNMGAYQTISDLKLYNGQIWFGSTRFSDVMGNTHWGFAAIDTATGVFMPAAVKLGFNGMGYTGFAKSGGFQDFLFSNDRFIGVGGFDYIDGNPVSNFANLKLVPGNSSVPDPATIVGADTIFTNNQYRSYAISPANRNVFSYNWTYSGTGVTISGNGNDTVLIKATDGATNGNLIVQWVNYCGRGPLTQKSIVIAAPPPPLPEPLVSGITDKCSANANAFAKLANPPVGVSVSVRLDGVLLNYNASDSSVQYFTSLQTALGQHTINVKYKYSYATGDSISKDFTFNVMPSEKALISLSGNTTVNQGTATNLQATASWVGSNPLYQWQDSSELHGWQNINGANSSLISYQPNKTGDKIRCLLVSNYVCVVNPNVTSAALTFVVNKPTGIPPLTPMSKSIKMYPNPVTTNLVIDSLQLSDKWEFLEVWDIVGTNSIARYSIKNKSTIAVPVTNLIKGMYVLVLRKRNGNAVYRKFIKQ